MNNKLTDKQAIEHSRYKIYESYFGKFDSERVIAFCDCLSDAKMLIHALNEMYKDRPMSFSYILCKEFDEILDTEI